MRHAALTSCNRVFNDLSICDEMGVHTKTQNFTGSTGGPNLMDAPGFRLGSDHLGLLRAFGAPMKHPEVDQHVPRCKLNSSATGIDTSVSSIF